MSHESRLDDAMDEILQLRTRLTAAEAERDEARRIVTPAIEALLVLAVLKITDAGAPYREFSPALREKLYAAHDSLLAALPKDTAKAALSSLGKERDNG